MLREIGNKTNLIVLILTTMLVTSFTTIKASEAADSIHSQLESGQDSAVAYLDNMDEAHSVIAEAIKIDTDSPYDADMMIGRGTSLKLRKYNNGKLEVVLVNPFDINESEKLLDTMEAEIRANLNEDATDKETLNQIIKYIGKTYTYDMFARTDWGDNKNFVDAYNSDKKIICNQYSALTYLLCDRFGIDCKIVSGNDHRYNAIRLTGEDTYTAYDLTKTTFFLPAKVGYIDLLSTNYSLALEDNELSKAIGKALNERIDFHYSITAEEIVIAGIVIIVIGKVAKPKKHTKRSAKRNRK